MNRQIKSFWQEIFMNCQANNQSTKQTTGVNMHNRLQLTIVVLTIAVCISGLLSKSLIAQGSTAQNDPGLMSSLYQNSLEAENEMIHLTDLLQVVENNFNVTFLYEREFMANKIVNKNHINMKREVGLELSEILINLGFTYQRIDEQTYVILSKPLDSEMSIIQQTISGVVSDAVTGETLPGVNIQIAGTQIGTTTDFNGEYELTNIPENARQLLFSFVGYQQHTVDINGRTQINVELSQSVAMLDDIVVIGYGERQRGDITGSISSVSADKLERGSTVSPELALQGRVPGLQVSGVSGNPLSRQTLRIRGISTFGVADPLIVIDGVPITEFGSGSEGSDARSSDLRGTVNILSMINPGDIESISVLKDASSAAIYGVRGANGVILITTKGGGRETSPQVQINANRGIQNVSQMSVLNVEQYANLYQESYANNPDQAGNLPSFFNPSSGDYLGNMSTVDWQNELRNQDAVTEDYSLRVSGGTQNVRYYVSGGYSRTEGSIRGSELERYSFAANLTTTVSERVRVGATYRLGYVEALNMGTSLEHGFRAPPWQPIYDSNGSFYDVQTYATTRGFAPSTTMSGERLWGPQSRQNPFGTQNMNLDSYDIIRNIGSAFVEIEPIRNLSLRGTLNADWYRQVRYNFEDMDSHWFSVTAAGPSPNLALDLGSIGSYRERNGTNYNLTGEFSANYVNNFGDHNIDLLGNLSRQEYGVDGIYGSTQYVPIRDPNQWVVTGTPDPSHVDTGSWTQKDALMGVMGRMSYNFDHRYYIDLTVRRDGTSRFADGYRWGTFPSVSASWRISSENFMENRFDFISDLRIRGGWGRLGNQETLRFAYISSVNSDGPTYAFGADGSDSGSVRRAAALPDFPIEDLSWETVTTTNVALDALFFNDRLSFTAEYYQRLTDGILQTVPLAASAGAQNNPTMNIAEVMNRGFEFEVGYQNAIGSLQYDVSANLTTVHNEVVSLFGGTPFGGDRDRIEEGESLFFYRGYKVGGIFQNQSEVDEWAAEFEEPGSIKSPGDIYYQDLNGDGVIDADDRTKIGSPIPDYYYGFNIDLFYSGFDLSLFFQGVGGFQGINGVREAGEAMSSDGTNQLTSVLNRWTPNNPSTTMPRAVRGDPGNNNRFSDRWVEDRDYLRLRNLQLGYSLSPELVDRLGMGSSTLRIFISGTNLFTITGWSGLDPENDNVPPARIISLGINMTIR